MYFHGPYSDTDKKEKGAGGEKKDDANINTIHGDKSEISTLNQKAHHDTWTPDEEIKK